MVVTVICGRIDGLFIGPALGRAIKTGDDVYIPAGNYWLVSPKHSKLVYRSKGRNRVKRVKRVLC